MRRDWFLRPDWGIAILRIVAGLVFLEHGNQKLFALGFPGVGGMLTRLGIPVPGFFAVVVTMVEFLGGLALIAGLLTRWAALLLSINMAVAVLSVHLKDGFFLPSGFEYALTLLAANACLVITGPGALALDHVLRRERGPAAPAGYRRAA